MKVVRSLQPKVIIIEESKDLDTVKIEELVGSLQIYELSSPRTNKKMSIALKTFREEPIPLMRMICIFWLKIL